MAVKTITQLARAIETLRILVERLIGGLSIISPYMLTLLDDEDTKAALTTLNFVGVVVPFAGTTAPDGWLFCFGQNVSRTTYAALFAVIGTTYGAGDGSTFGLPDLRGRVIAGQDDMGGTSANRLTSPLDGDVLGGAGGSESHALTAAQNGPHNHLYAAGQLINTLFTAGGSPLLGWNAAINDSGTSSSGSGSAHNNVQPTFILNYMIFAGA